MIAISAGDSANDHGEYPDIEGRAVEAAAQHRDVQVHGDLIERWISGRQRHHLAIRDASWRADADREHRRPDTRDRLASAAKSGVGAI